MYREILGDLIDIKNHASVPVSRDVENMNMMYGCRTTVKFVMEALESVASAMLSLQTAGTINFDV